ncbi:MAG: response regulator [Lachnospiraceae bacterium]|nr:response regulator [Lachnospiraceae bacterium]
MVENRVLFVSDRETFIVKSIIKKLESERVICDFATIDVKAISKYKDNDYALTYFYIDDKSDFNIEGMTYLRDLCIDKDSELYLIGYEETVSELKKRIFQGHIAGEYYRPVNAGQLVEEVLKEVDKEKSMCHKKHILVVDDSGVMLSTIKEWLGDKYRVTPVNSALNAITFLSKEKPDLILLDYEMPACSGPKFLEMLRADVSLSDIPVIFLTGRDDAESVKSVIALRPAGYLLKSLPKEKIVGEVDAFFAKQKAK